MPSARTLVVKLTCGTDVPEKLAQAFTVAATAVASGIPVSLWLTGEAVRTARPGVAEAFELPHSSPLASFRDAILADGSITVCTQCAVRRGLTEADLLPGVQIRGAASFVEEAMAEGAQALVY